MTDWTTDDVRGWLTSDPRFNDYGHKMQGEKFDAWLAGVKAETLRSVATLLDNGYAHQLDGTEAIQRIRAFADVVDPGVRLHPAAPPPDRSWVTTEEVVDWPRK